MGMAPSSVHERCVKLGINNKINIFTDEEMSLVEDLYKEGFLGGDGKLDKLAYKLGRTKQFICRKAKDLGLTDYKKKACKKLKEKNSKRVKQWLQENDHPRGFLGGCHTEEARASIGRKNSAWWDSLSEDEKRKRSVKRVKTMQKNGTIPTNRKKASWKSGWRKIGQTRNFYRSRWEANYGRYLELQKTEGSIISWEHEPKRFFFTGNANSKISYLPDFRVTAKCGEIEYHEVKGWMDERSRAIIDAMNIDYPEVTLVLIQQKEYNQIKKRFSNKIEDWENSQEDVPV